MIMKVSLKMMLKLVVLLVAIASAEMRNIEETESVHNNTENAAQGVVGSTAQGIMARVPFTDLKFAIPLPPYCCPKRHFICCPH